MNDRVATTADQRRGSIKQKNINSYAPSTNGANHIPSTATTSAAVASTHKQGSVDDTSTKNPFLTAIARKEKKHDGKK
jgi:hypothetical protein